MMSDFVKNTRRSYDSVAKEYADRFIDEMDKKPFDRKMLELLSERVNHRGLICDLGCGPGNIARYLHRIGTEVCGIDLSDKQVEQARRLNPDIKFYQADMLDLNMIEDGYFGGIAAFYSIIHIPKDLVVNALKEMHRTLRSPGEILLAFHMGDNIEHLDEFFGKKVNLDFMFFQTGEMKENLIQAGFELTYVIEREPVKQVEVETRRAYVFATKK
jgi:SAM-dependent methyltransferase